MVRLPAFSGSTFRQFMTAPIVAQQQPAEPERAASPTPSPQHPRPKQTGIREDSYESCDLPKSNDILQHLSESYRTRQASPIASGYDGLEDIEAELNHLKEDVLRLREEADHERAACEAEQAPGQRLSPRRGELPAPNDHKEVSMAARLQKMHEDAERDSLKAKAQPPPEPPQPPPPSPLDFPVLGTPTASMSSKSNTPTDARWSSYADAATSGLSKKSAKATAASRSPLASQESGDSGTYVFVSPSEGKAAAMDDGKRAPHFAQPTQSYARRAGETVRKDADSSPTKAPADAATLKSAKGKEPKFATEQRLAQRQQKRKSLPGDWMNEPAASSASPGRDSADVGSLAAESSQASSPSKAKGRSTGLSIKTNLSPTQKTFSKIAQAQQSPRVQKKPSTYMSPTSATTQRTAATLGKERAKKDSPSPKRRLLKPELSPSKQDRALSPVVGAAASDTSSVQFILDRPAPLFAMPISRTGSPVAQFLDEQHVERSSSPFGSPRGSPSRLARRPRPNGPTSSYAASPEHYPPQNPPTPDYRTLYSMPSISKTSTVRRTSHSQILSPILARLSAQGLARDSHTSPTSPDTTAADVNNALSSARESMPSEAILQEGRPSVLGHARRVGPLPHNDHAEHADQSIASLAPERIPIPARSSPLSSLRATASEFTPRKQPAVLGATVLPEEWATYSEPSPRRTVSELTAFRPAEEWMNIPFDQKVLISRLRALTGHQGSRSSGAQAWNRFNTLDGSPLGWTMVDNDDLSHVLQPTDALRPSTITGRKSVHWTLDTGDGLATPVSFGRAAAPPFESAFMSPHATISPTSDDTSPFKTPRTVSGQPWSIDSAGASSLPYGWTGGDGKEIRFVGYGPHAERDPNSTVSFGFRGQYTSVANMSLPPRDPGAARHARDKENEVAFGTIAPRSQKQWAQKLGLEREPCNNMVVEQATEMIPFANHLAAYCFDCAAGP